jgi:hypothetical protein
MTSQDTWATYLWSGKNASCKGCMQHQKELMHECIIRAFCRRWLYATLFSPSSLPRSRSCVVAVGTAAILALGFSCAAARILICIMHMDDETGKRCSLECDHSGSQGIPVTPLEKEVNVTLSPASLLVSYLYTRGWPVQRWSRLVQELCLPRISPIGEGGDISLVDLPIQGRVRRHPFICPGRVWAILASPRRGKKHQGFVDR